MTATTPELNHEQRHQMNLVWWHSDGYQFVLIGRNPTSQLKQNALTLQAALSWPKARAQTARCRRA